MKRNEENFGISEPKEKIKRPLSERLGSILDIPTDLLCGGCYMEMRGQNDLLLQGCRSIARYSEEEIVLQLCRDQVRIRGRGLSCISYHADKMEICGWITEIDFLSAEGSE